MQTHSTTEAYRPNHDKKRWYKQLYFWVLLAIIIGVLLGWLSPSAGVAMEPIGTTFVTAMKMLIGPIVFLTIVGCIASVADLKKVGLTGIKALTYFQVGTILAMIFGLVAINIFRVGDGVNANPSTIETSESAQKLITTGETKQWWEFITHLVPDSVVGPFVEGDVLQIIFLAVLFGVALNAVGHIGGPVLDLINRGTKIVFKILNYVMKLAPLGAFGAMAYAIGGQVNYYVMQAFAGLHAGFEVVYVHTGGSDRTGGYDIGNLRESPYLGYKWTARNGFTALAQVGLALDNASVHVDTPNMAVAMANPPMHQRALDALVNFGVGWSF